MLIITRDNLHTDNWIDIRDLDMYLQSKSVPETPIIEIAEVEVTGGRILKQSKNYTTRNIRVNLVISKKNTWEVKRTLIDLVKILQDEIVIRFKDKVDIIYFTELTKQIDTDKITNEAFTFTLEFTCYDSYRYSIDKAGILTLDSDMTLDNEVALCEDTEFTDIKNTTNIQLNNVGNYIAKPIIILEGTASIINISCNGITTTYKNLNLGEIVYIDCKEYTVTKKINNDKTNALLNWWGDFIYLKSGINDIQIAGTNLNIQKLKIDYRHTFL